MGLSSILVYQKNHTNQIITDNKALEIYFKTVLLHMFNLSFIKIKANNIK